MQHGVTITPTTVETTEGDVVTDFEIVGHPAGYDSQDPNFGAQEYFVDRWGQSHHELENVDFEEFDEDPEMEMDHAGYFLENVVELAGGVESYQRTIAWAQHNLSAEQQDQYNQAMNSADPEIIEAAVLELMHAQQESQQPEQRVSELPEDPMTEEHQQGIYNAVGGEHAYRHMTAWAREEMSEDQIDRFNHLMSVGSAAEVVIGVQWLQQQYRQANTRG